MVSSNEISSRGAKDILRSMHQRGGSPREVAKELNLFQESDAESLRAIVSKVLSAHPTVVLDFKGGKESALHYLIGQCMKETQGSANPSVLREILKEALK
jgi:aspartyl-tRNA(Asn)/glutamyl-tRNA(Gln) amidotransferase subunit B